MSRPGNRTDGGAKLLNVNPSQKRSINDAQARPVHVGQSGNVLQSTRNRHGKLQLASQTVNVKSSIGRILRRIVRADDDLLLAVPIDIAYHWWRRQIRIKIL